MANEKIKNPPLVTAAIILSVIALGAILYLINKEKFLTPTEKGPEPVLIHPYQTQDKGDDRAPTVAYGNNKWVIVWQSSDDLTLANYLSLPIT